MNLLAPMRWMLKLLPKDLRDEYGHDVLVLFEVRLEEHARKSRHAAIRYWFHGMADLIRTVWRARTRGPAMRPGLSPDRRGNFFDSLRLDFWQSVRSLRRQPKFTALVVMTLGVGIGATTTIFSVMDAVLLRPLPFPEPDRLVRVGVRTVAQTSATAPEPDLVAAWKEENRQFEALDWMTPQVSPYTMSGAGHAVLVRRQWAGPTLFRVLGVAPFLGRDFLPTDFQIKESKNQGTTALLSYEFWQRHFNGDASILGTSVTILGLSRVIIGVMPAGFRISPTAPDTDVWMPQDYRGTGQRIFAAGRLKSAVTVEQAAGELQAIVDGRQPNAREKDRLLVSITPLGAPGRETYRSSLYLIAGAVSLVLLICCINVVGLLLVRGAARAREIATRLALGATRRRVIRQLMVESVLLASLGGVVGVFVAMLGLRLFVIIASDWFPATETFGLNLRVLGFAVVVSLLTGVVTGLAPALTAPATNLMLVVRQGFVERGRFARRRLGSTLVVVEVALAMILVVGVGLMVNSLARILTVDMGFDPKGLLTAQIRTQGNRYQISETGVHLTPPAVANFYERLAAQLATEPGVESVGLISTLPSDPQVARVRFRVVGSAVPASDPPQFVQYQEVNDDLFKTLRVPVVSGRSFTRADTESSPWVAIVNETLARQFFGDVSPLGQTVRADLSNGVKHPELLGDRPREIVGVVTDLHTNQRRKALPAMYVPFHQHQSVYPAAGPWTFPGPWAVHLQKDVVIRTSSDPKQMIGALRAAVAAVDDTQVAHDIKTMEDGLSAAAGVERRWMRLLGLCAAMALFLAALGIYGVVSQTVAKRTREIGIRMALGADRGRVMLMVIRQGMLPVFVGVVVGAAAALLLTGLMASLLFDVAPTDALTFAAAVVVLAAVGTLACYLPARRTTWIRPIVALRQD